jgi:hypothetical protein
MNMYSTRLPLKLFAVGGGMIKSSSLQLRSFCKHPQATAAVPSDADLQQEWC